MKVIVIISIFAAANAAFLPNDQGKYSKCDKGCPMIYLPVCGGNGNGKFEIFSNDCVMDVENCKLQVRNEAVFTEAPMANCEVKTSECNQICPDNYAPVCGSDTNGKYTTFATECTMEVENCNLRSRNEIGFSPVPMTMCENQEQSNEIIMIQNDIEDDFKHCNIPCLDIYDPVCGYNGHSEARIFASECEMQVQNCRVRVRKGFAFMRLPLRNCELLDSALTLKTVEKTRNCNKICTADYTPICGYNGFEYRTFGNRCDFEVQNCESNFNWRFTREGECAPPSN